MLHVTVNVTVRSITTIISTHKILKMRQFGKFGVAHENIYIYLTGKKYFISFERV